MHVAPVKLPAIKKYLADPKVELGDIYVPNKKDDVCYGEDGRKSEVHPETYLWGVNEGKLRRKFGSDGVEIKFEDVCNCMRLDETPPMFNLPYTMLYARQGAALVMLKLAKNNPKHLAKIAEFLAAPYTDKYDKDKKGKTLLSAIIKNDKCSLCDVISFDTDTDTDSFTFLVEIANDFKSTNPVLIESIVKILQSDEALLRQTLSGQIGGAECCKTLFGLAGSYPILLDAITRVLHKQEESVGKHAKSFNFARRERSCIALLDFAAEEASKTDWSLFAAISDDLLHLFQRCVPGLKEVHELYLGLVNHYMKAFVAVCKRINKVAVTDLSIIKMFQVISEIVPNVLKFDFSFSASGDSKERNEFKDVYQKYCAEMLSAVAKSDNDPALVDAIVQMLTQQDQIRNTFLLEEIANANNLEIFEVLLRKANQGEIPSSVVISILDTHSKNGKTALENIFAACSLSDLDSIKNISSIEEIFAARSSTLISLLEFTQGQMDARPMFANDVVDVISERDESGIPQTLLSLCGRGAYKNLVELLGKLGDKLRQKILATLTTTTVHGYNLPRIINESITALEEMIRMTTSAIEKAVSGFTSSSTSTTATIGDKEMVSLKGILGKAYGGLVENFRQVDNDLPKLAKVYPQLQQALEAGKNKGISQFTLIEQFSKYNRLKGRGNVKPLGLCYGLSICFGVMASIGELDGWLSNLAIALTWDGTVESLEKVVEWTSAEGKKSGSLGELFGYLVDKVYESQVVVNPINDMLDSASNQHAGQGKQLELSGSKQMEFFENFEILTKDGKKKIAKEVAIAGHMDHPELVAYLDELKEKWSKSSGKDFVCLLCSCNHACSLCYDKTNNTWIFYDPNSLNCVRLNNTEDLSQKIVAHLGKNLAIRVGSFGQEIGEFKSYEKVCHESPEKLDTGDGVGLDMIHLFSRDTFNTIEERLEVRAISKRSSSAMSSSSGSGSSSSAASSTTAGVSSTSTVSNDVLHILQQSAEALMTSQFLAFKNYSIYVEEDCEKYSGLMKKYMESFIDAVKHDRKLAGADSKITQSVIGVFQVISAVVPKMLKAMKNSCELREGYKKYCTTILNLIGATIGTNSIFMDALITTLKQLGSSRNGVLLSKIASANKPEIFEALLQKVKQGLLPDEIVVNILCTQTEYGHTPLESIFSGYQSSVAKAVFEFAKNRAGTNPVLINAVVAALSQRFEGGMLSPLFLLICGGVHSDLLEFLGKLNSAQQQKILAELTSAEYDGYSILQIMKKMVADADALTSASSSSLGTTTTTTTTTTATTAIASSVLSEEFGKKDILMQMIEQLRQFDKSLPAFVKGYPQLQQGLESGANQGISQVRLREQFSKYNALKGKVNSIPATFGQGLSLYFSAMAALGELDGWMANLSTAAAWDGKEESLKKVVELTCPDGKRQVKLGELFEFLVKEICKCRVEVDSNIVKLSLFALSSNSQSRADLFETACKQADLFKDFEILTKEGKKKIVTEVTIAGHMEHPELVTYLGELKAKWSKSGGKDFVCLLYSSKGGYSLHYNKTNDKWILHNPASSGYEQLDSTEKLVGRVLSLGKDLAIRIGSFGEDIGKFATYEKVLAEDPRKLIEGNGMAMFEQFLPESDSLKGIKERLHLEKSEHEFLFFSRRSISLIPLPSPSATSSDDNTVSRDSSSSSSSSAAPASVSLRAELSPVPTPPIVAVNDGLH